MMSRRKKESLEQRLKAYRKSQLTDPEGYRRQSEAATAQRKADATRREVEELTKLNVPVFPYRRDLYPGQGIIRSSAVCDCCGQARGAVVGGCGPLCPWCLVDGSGFEKYGFAIIGGWFCDAEYNKVELAEHYYRDVFGCMPPMVTNNPFGWWVHCGEPAAYLRRDEPYDLVFECIRCGQRQVIEDWD